MHNQIAKAMWVNYEHLLEERDPGELDLSTMTNASENDQIM